MRKERVAFSHGRSGSWAARSEHCDESAWKDASAWAAFVFWDVASPCCVLRQPRRSKDTQPTTGFQPDNRFGYAASRKEVLGCRRAPRQPSHSSVGFRPWAVSSQVLYFPSAQSMSTVLLGNRLHFRSCVPNFSKPFHRCFLWSFVFTVRTVQCQTYKKFVVRASRVSGRDAVPTKVAHAPQPLFVEQRAQWQSLSCLQVSVADAVRPLNFWKKRRGRCRSINGCASYQTEASRTLSERPREAGRVSCSYQARLVKRSLALCTTMQVVVRRERPSTP